MTTPISRDSFLSTPSARRATIALGDFVFSFGISIHALREEGDPPKLADMLRAYLFLSTPSARRATLESSSVPRIAANFYPRPPRGGRHPTHRP